MSEPLAPAVAEARAAVLVALDAAIAVTQEVAERELRHRATERDYTREDQAVGHLNYLIIMLRHAVRTAAGAEADSPHRQLRTP